MTIPEDEPHATAHILVREHFELVPIPIERVAWFMNEHRLTFVCEKDGARHMVDETLGALEKTLAPRRFFRLNRHFLAHPSAVKSVHSVGRGRLGVVLSPSPDEDVVVSHERAAQLRAWLEEARRTPGDCPAPHAQGCAG